MWSELREPLSDWRRSLVITGEKCKNGYADVFSVFMLTGRGMRGGKQGLVQGEVAFRKESFK